ncbi:hypothetical protein JG688_00018599 [Phytophthora aleatoria]|uniref:Uncharacterized protein n=1 Tax=Phytophthora aleatoria TaxID=2496075 RepID=A0A8J5I1F1_9STRA|nr:hypothetical protein JG688_00018599 [Phytophthora aleatoria]
MLADGYAVLHGHIKRIFESINEFRWSYPVAMYAKPTNNAPQRKYVQLSDNTEIFKSQLEVIWQKARLRKHGQGAFVLQHFVYVLRCNGPTRCHYFGLHVSTRVRGNVVCLNLG